MNFDKESKPEEKKFFFEGGGGMSGRGVVRFVRKINNKNNRYSLIFFVLMLYMKFQAPRSSGSLVLTQIKSIENCKRNCRDMVYC